MTSERLLRPSASHCRQLDSWDGGPERSHGSRNGWTVLQNPARKVGTNDGTRTGYLTFCHVFCRHLREYDNSRCRSLPRLDGRSGRYRPGEHGDLGNLPQRARDGWLDAVRAMLPRRTRKPRDAPSLSGDPCGHEGATPGTLHPLQCYTAPRRLSERGRDTKCRRRIRIT